ncbi:hypothetical protein [Bdellovibrio bacteriovorus]|uniref:Porin n=1 Tax=Bdellovibrio bacteriovorus str. Tiberius TaxID=1069642 RepID=K7YRL7_BDEBC|nr:hypothetical protein [Bdellovibrio bacteriovorus]AFY00258.1 hypothetical protein Bdt_0550 [Bdellovibrio bacteriovorus str. Tiberius]
MKWALALIFAMSSAAQAQEKTTTTTTTVIQSTSTTENTPKIETKAEEAPVLTQVATVTEVKKEYPQFEFTSYGYISFSQAETFKTVQNLDPIVRRSMDLAEFAFEGEYKLTDSSKIEFEVEIEHGGVGTTIEFDPFEEFGEFEQEIEKGGEVVLHEIYYKKDFKKTDTAVRIGKFPLFISLGSVLTKPHKYPTILASDLEGRMMPLGWTETGVGLEQKIKYGFTARAALVNGLNSEFFRTYSWVGGGYQRHFESMNADNLATVFSLEWGNISKGTGIAYAQYAGDSTDNRYKVDKLKVPAEVRITTVMGNYKWKGIGIAAEYIEGSLDNSDKVSAANATLGGLAKPKAFAPLGHKAKLESVQLSYDWETPGLVFFLKAEHVNTFADVQGSIVKNPRYDVSRRSGGFMWMWDTAAFMKVQYARDKTELEGLPETYQANVAFGFDLSAFEK